MSLLYGLMLVIASGAVSGASSPVPNKPLSYLQCAAAYRQVSERPVSEQSKAAIEARLWLIAAYARDNGLLPDMVAPDVATVERGLESELALRGQDSDRAVAQCDQQFGFQVAGQSDATQSGRPVKLATSSPLSLSERMAKWAKEPQTGTVNSTCDNRWLNIRVTKSMTRSDIVEIAKASGCDAANIDNMLQTYDDSKAQLDSVFRH